MHRVTGCVSMGFVWKSSVMRCGISSGASTDKIPHRITGLFRVYLLQRAAHLNVIGRFHGGTDVSGHRLRFDGCCLEKFCNALRDFVGGIHSLYFAARNPAESSTAYVVV